MNELNRISSRQHLLGAFVFIHNHCAAKSIVKEFNSVHCIPRGYQDLKQLHKSWMKLL